MKFLRNKFFQLILFVGFGVTLLYLVYRGQEQEFVANCVAQYGAGADCDFLSKVFDDFKEADLRFIFLAIFIFLLSNVFRALRWNMQFKAMGYFPKFLNSFFSIVLGYFVNLGFPRAGELARIAALSRNENIPIEKVAGSLVVDRGVDVLCLLVVISLAIGFEFDQMIDFLSKNARFDPKFLILLLIPIGLLVWFLRVRKTSSMPFIKKINSLFDGFTQGIVSFLKLKNKGLFLAYTVGIWICYYLMTHVVFFSFEPTSNLPTQAGLVVFVFGSLGMVIPSPGGSGSYHYLIMKGLELYNVSSYDGFTLANLIFIPIQLIGNIAFGLIALIALPMLKREEP